MELSAGSRLGPYEITGLLGTGGMGEVYRAVDTRLHRDVAIKVSAEAFSNRFEKEARAVAALNHPNISHLYDVGPNYLVLELVEGETLAERIRRGALPLEEALGLARQMVEALDAAHEKGIVHRDLKPANIKITPDGAVKVLDFGLAKFNDPAISRGGDPDHSPTVTLDQVTRAGTIMGTASYMSPEQAKGKPTDKRADIWSFGVVLYEVLTGRRLFCGEDLADTLVRVIRDEPDLTAAPRPVRRLLARCLEKDPKRRLRDIRDVWELLDESAAAELATRSRGWLPWAICGASLVLAGASIVFFQPRAPAQRMRPIHFQLSVPDDTASVSPDGSYITYGSRGTPAWLRSLDSPAERPLTGAENARGVFWSPDNKSVAFYLKRKLMRMDLAGGTPQVLCDAEPTETAGGSWGRDGTILFASKEGLLRVPATGGTPVPVTKPNASRGEGQHGFPQWLPDGKHFLYFVLSRDPQVAGIYVASVDNPTPPPRILETTRKAAFAPPHDGYPGYLLFIQSGKLMAQAFDAGRLTLEGAPAMVTTDVALRGTLANAYFWVSAAGVLVYSALDSARAPSTLVWLDRQGKAAGSAGKPEVYWEMAMSPDGSRVAAFRHDEIGSDLWLVDFARNASTRLTTEPGNESYPVWSADSKQVVFSGSDPPGFYRKAAGASGQRVLVLKDPGGTPTDWSHDGRFLLYSKRNLSTQGGNDLWMVPMNEADPKPVKYLATQFAETSARFSPDGRWVVYASDVSGTKEIYVSPFPDAAKAPAVMVSSGGGSQPRWRRDGKAIYYLSFDRKLMEAPVTAGATFQTGIPHALFPIRLMNLESSDMWTWDVTPDNQRFLVNQYPVEGATVPLNVVVNWQAKLKK